VGVPRRCQGGRRGSSSAAFLEEEDSGVRLKKGCDNQNFVVWVVRQCTGVGGHGISHSGCCRATVWGPHKMT
jgi:hypothetical protein